MTLEEAIARIEGHTQYYVPVDDLPALEIALDVLRSQAKEEKNELLTLDELREMDGNPVWVVPKGKYADMEAGYCVINDFIAEIPGAEYMWFELEEYSVNWQAYRKKPCKITE